MLCIPFNGSLNISAAMYASTGTGDSCLILNKEMWKTVSCLPYMYILPVIWMLQATSMLCPSSIYQLRPAKHTLPPLSADHHPFRKLSKMSCLQFESLGELKEARHSYLS